MENDIIQLYQNTQQIIGITTPIIGERANWLLSKSAFAQLIGIVCLDFHCYLLISIYSTMRERESKHSL